jgi:uncharacterized protein
MKELDQILQPYNPWWQDAGEAFAGLPSFHRPVFERLVADLKTLPQIISITGPRRIGKSTLLRQIVRSLIGEGIAPERIVYYSFDDPALIGSGMKIDDLFDELMKRAVRRKDEGTTFVFLDEIERLDRWELFLKKYFDLQYPVKIVISGSASAPIFGKSRESLLGRIKNFHLLPFSFREFVLFSLQDRPVLLSEVRAISEKGKTVQGMFAGDPEVNAESVKLQCPGAELRLFLESALSTFFMQGGFPEVWALPTLVARQEYLFDNQVKKVIYEDLLIAAEFRKPELLKRFYFSLLEMPGREMNMQTVTSETNIGAGQIEKYLPLLEMTDLVYHISKFRKESVRVRRGLMKFYLVDLALRNAVLRLSNTLLQDESILGFYAENLVFLALKKWRGTIQMDYYRDRSCEVDFIVHVGPSRLLPVEVKYRNEIRTSDLNGLRKFSSMYKSAARPLLITRRWDDFGKHDEVFFLPLPVFLLLFD